MPKEFKCIFKIHKAMTLSKAKNKETNQLSIASANLEKLYCNKDVELPCNYLFNPYNYIEEVNDYVINQLKQDKEEEEKC